MTINVLRTTADADLVEFHNSGGWDCAAAVAVVCCCHSGCHQGIVRMTIVVVAMEIMNK